MGPGTFWKEIGVAEEMRIALIGQAAFGQSVLDAFIEQGETIVGVFCPPDQEGRAPDPLKTAAEAHGTPVFQFGRLRDAEAIEAFRSIEADLAVMAFVTDIVPEEILRAPKRETIQYHPSLLPRHRGPSSMNWPIIQGEARTGLSVFWPDAGLDTGPILLQKEVDIAPDDTLGALYFDKLFPMGVEAMVEAVGMVRNGTAPRVEQDESEATYEGWCRAKECVVDWERPVEEVYNLLRGTDPQPGAMTSFNGTSVQLYRTARVEKESGGLPGSIVEVDEEGVVVAAADGRLRIGRVKPKGGPKATAFEWAQEAGLEVGMTLGE